MGLRSIRGALDLDDEEERGLTLVDPLEQLRVARVTVGQLGKSVAEVEQQGEPVTSRWIDNSGGLRTTSNGKISPRPLSFL